MIKKLTKKDRELVERALNTYQKQHEEIKMKEREKIEEKGFSIVTNPRIYDVDKNVSLEKVQTLQAILDTIEKENEALIETHEQKLLGLL